MTTRRRKNSWALWVLIVWAGCIGIARAEILAFVTNLTGNSVSMIDVATGQVTATFPVGTAPVGITADTVRNVVYVANSGSASITRINLATLQTSTLSLPGSEPESVVWTPFGDRLLVTSLERVVVGPGSRGKVYLVDVPSFTVSTSVLVEDDPEGVHVSLDGDQLWIASDLKIQELDLDPDPMLFLTLTDVIDGTLGVDDFEHVAVLPNKSRLFASNQLADRVEVIDLSTETIITSIPTGASPEAVVFRPGTNEVHVTNQLSDNVTIFDRVTFSVLGTVSLSQLEPKGLAFLPDGSEAYVVMSASDSVVRYDGATRTEIGTPIGVGQAPEEIVIFDAVVLNSAQRWPNYE